DRIEPLLDGAGRLVGCQNAAAGRDHGLGHLVKLCEVHRLLHRFGILADFAASSRRWQRVMTPDACDHFARSTSTPGNDLPSSHSRKAPPAVQTQLKRP